VRQFAGKRYWIVGASAGLGRAFALALSKTGAELVLSARSEDELNALAQECPGKAMVVPVDIANSESVAKAADAAGDIDGIVLLAGVYWPMSARDFDGEKAAKMLDVNLTGTARVLGHVVPRMVERGDGHIVLTGSLSGFRGLPGAVGYGASKAGIMSLAETMHADLKGSGVDVQLVNPGFIKTRLTDKNDFTMPFIMEPEAAAREMLEHMQGDSFSHNFPTLFSLFFRASQFLPDWLYYGLLRR
jgi:short-subunit dehydrogenase